MTRVTVGSGDHHVVAVHGWFGSARGWGSLPDYLDGSAYTYVFPDLRGYGDRKQAGGEFTMDEAAADVLTLADEFGWDRFSVVGHSMGGKAAHQVLLQAPDRVRALVGINPVPAAQVPMDEQTLLSRSFTPRAVAQLEHRIRSHARAICDRVFAGPRGECDFARDVAADLPLLTLADVLGLPERDRLLLFDWSNRVIGYQDPDYATSAGLRHLGRIRPGCGDAHGRRSARAAAGARPRWPDAGPADPGGDA